MKSFNAHKVSAEHAGLTVEAYLKEILQYSGRKIQKLTRQKGILLNSKKVFLQKKIKADDIVRILVLADTSYGVQPEPGTVEIIYEDKFVIVVNKPPYQLVHPTGQTTGGTLANFLAYHLQQQGIVSTIRPVHRLDRDTSGCVVFAKDARSQSLLEQQLKQNQFNRTYWALIAGQIEPPSGTIEVPIGPHPRLANRRAVDPTGDPAITHYLTLRSSAEASLLELSLDTGRTHQIRVHLAHLGYPIIGDGMYGVRHPLMKRQALHAVAVSFAQPGNGQVVTIQAPLPTDFAQTMENCNIIK